MLANKECRAMRGIKIALGLAVVACLLAVLAAPALATPSWYKCAETVGGKFIDNKCTTEGAGGEFEWVRIEKTTEVTLEGELEFEDSKTSVGAVRIKCKVKGTGSVGPDAEDQVKTLDPTGCTVVKGTCGSPTLAALHLPWVTELFEEAGGVIKDKVKGSGVGPYGWVLTCTVIIVIKDECTGEAIADTANVLAEGIVEVKFANKSGKLKCTQSKVESGSVEGVLKVKTVSGVAISVKP
jgi:hypothetical protein